MNPILWIRIGAGVATAAAIAFACWWAVDQLEERGRAEVRAEWNAEKTERAAAALEAERENRRFEQRRAAMIQETNDAYAKEARAARAAAAGARTELQRVLDATAERERQAAADPAPAGGTDGAAGALAVVRSCAARAVGLAEVADDTAAKLASLQGWVRQACVTPPAP